MRPSDDFVTGDIIIVSGKSWVSRAIKFVTFGKASHVALVCGDRIYETDGAWRKSKFSDIEKYDGADITVFRVKSFTDEHKHNILSVCVKRLGTWYSYWDCFVEGALSIFNPKITKRVANKISSSLVTKCDEEVQICHNLARKEEYFEFPSGKNPQILMEELLISEDAEVVYQSK